MPNPQQISHNQRLKRRAEEIVPVPADTCDDLNDQRAAIGAGEIRAPMRGAAAAKRVLISVSCQPVDKLHVRSGNRAERTDQFILDIAVGRILISQGIASGTAGQHVRALQIGFRFDEYRVANNIYTEVNFAIDMKPDKRLPD